MPRKLRQLRADLRRAGFAMRPGRGSHTVWEHPLIPDQPLTLSGADGDDAQRYQEQQLRDRLAALAAKRAELAAEREKQ